MKAIISTTYDDLYLFFLPLVAWSWKKIGVDVSYIRPLYIMPRQYDRFKLANDYAYNKAGALSHIGINAPLEKEATYMQCARIYASAYELFNENEVLITGDVDMAVFGDYFLQANSGQIHVFGTDLVPPNQYPICYIAMPVKTWREVMWITPGVPVQQYLDELLGPIECEHFRGNMWGRDQETIFNQLEKGSWPIVKHERAISPHQFATRRADRDGWPNTISPDIIDSHLPRPGHSDENWSKIFNLFRTMYPNEDLQWMEDYRNQYIKLV